VANKTTGTPARQAGADSTPVLSADRMFFVPLYQDQDAAELTEDVIRRLFSPATLEAGRVYEARGRVCQLEISPDGTRIEAETIGSLADPYDQVITMQHLKHRGFVVNAACSCPVGRQCKHLAAVMIAAQRRQAAAKPVAAGRPSPAPAPLSIVQPRPQFRYPDAGDAPLPFAVGHWLADLQTRIEDASEAYPPSVRSRMIYVLDRDTRSSGVPRLTIAPYVVNLLKTGALGSRRPYHPGSNQRFVRPSDRVILHRLSSFSPGFRTADADDDPADTVRRVLATGRAGARRWPRERRGRDASPGPWTATARNARP
jgi:hypothetical protein